MRSKPVSSLAMPFGIAMVLCLVVAGATTGRAWAQDPTPGTFCTVLSPEEVSDAMYTTFVTSKGTDTACEWDVVPGEQGDSIFGAYLSVEVERAKYSDIAQAYPDATKESVLGHDAFLTPPFFGIRLYVDVGLPGRRLTLGLLGPKLNVDPEAVLVYLAEIVVERLPSFPLAAPAGDPELASLFPASLGGEPLEVTTDRGPDLLRQIGEESPTASILLQGLAAAGKTADDVTVGNANATVAGAGMAILAVRVAGVDAILMAPTVLSAFGAYLAVTPDATQTPMTIAGKDVAQINMGRAGAGQTYLYADGEVVWLVFAAEPTLTEIFEKLP